MKKSILFPLSLISLGMSGVASADNIKINGFANLTAGISNQETAAIGYKDELELNNGSLFALQVSGKINDKLSATAQVIARGDDNYSASFEWAYLKYEFNDNHSVLAGRFRTPVFMYSASLDVGYSYHWISAPTTVYDVAFNNINGLRYDYTTYLGDWDVVFQATAGNYENEISGGRADAKEVLVGSLEGSYESFKARVVAGRGRNNFTQAAFDAGIDQLGAIAPDIADLLRMNDDVGIFLGAGFSYDNFEWFVNGEITSLETEDSFSPKDFAWYLSGGARFGKWTPHLTYEMRDGDRDIKFLDGVNAFPEPARPTLVGVITALQAPFMEDFSVITAGARYDVDTNIALKAELSKYDNKLEPGVGIRGESVDTTVLRVSVNYIF
jgi:hypothetical protein